MAASARVVENGVTLLDESGEPLTVGPIRATTPYTGYMELGELARLFAVSPATIRRRLKAQSRSLYLAPGDQRLRMVKEADIRAIFQIVPARQRVRGDNASEG